jgi:hypothetical protein
MRALEISSSDGLVLLPLRTLYDWETVVEHIRWRAQRGAPCTIRWGAAVWTVAADGGRCATCDAETKPRLVHWGEQARCLACGVDALAKALRPRRRPALGVLTMWRGHSVSDTDGR